jgi:hypothetical protein
MHEQPFFCVDKARMSTKMKNITSFGLIIALAFGIYCTLRQHGHLAGGPVDMRHQASGSIVAMALLMIHVYGESCPAPPPPPVMMMQPPLPPPPPQEAEQQLTAPPPPPPGQSGRSPHYR